jgi:Ca2+-binding EF-hand superfamily protein
MYKDRKSEVDKLFRLLDEKKQNFLTIEDLRSITADLGEHCSEAELREMIKRTDTNGDGRITIDDLYNILTK